VPTPGRLPKRLVAVALGLVLAWFAAEAFVAIGDFDWRVIRPLLYYQEADTRSQRHVTDPHVIYRLAPGRVEYRESPRSPDGYVVTVNELGARSPAMTAAKPAGIFRIVCVGGSNVYGLGVSDEQTWPWQLQDALNEAAPGRFEVLNFGAPGHVPVQMIALAREAVERYGADLVLFALSNLGPPPFPVDAPVAGYFSRDPELWRGFVDPECAAWPDVPDGLKMFAARHSRVLRYFFARELARVPCPWAGSYPLELRNLRLAREFFAWTRERAVPVAIFLFPGSAKNAFDYSLYHRDTDLPVMNLTAEDRPAEYRDVHPPGYVYAWYAQRLAAWLHETKLVQ
jgi:hypothetical protein